MVGIVKRVGDGCVVAGDHIVIVVVFGRCAGIVTIDRVAADAADQGIGSGIAADRIGSPEDGPLIGVAKIDRVLPRADLVQISRVIAVINDAIVAEDQVVTVVIALARRVSVESVGPDAADDGIAAGIPVDGVATATGVLIIGARNADEITHVEVDLAVVADENVVAIQVIV